MVLPVFEKVQMKKKFNKIIKEQMGCIILVTLKGSHKTMASMGGLITQQLIKLPSILGNDIHHMSQVQPKYGFCPCLAMFQKLLFQSKGA
jgi:hypothetical protein